MPKPIYENQWARSQRHVAKEGDSPALLKWKADRNRANTRRKLDRLKTIKAMAERKPL